MYSKNRGQIVVKKREPIGSNVELLTGIEPVTSALP